MKIDAEKLAKVERIDLARSVVATGKIQPVTQVEIKSKASGIIQKLPVNVGDVVRKGQVICANSIRTICFRRCGSSRRRCMWPRPTVKRAGRLRALQSGCRRARMCRF